MNASYYWYQVRLKDPVKQVRARLSAPLVDACIREWQRRNRGATAKVAPGRRAQKALEAAIRDYVPELKHPSNAASMQDHHRRKREYREDVAKMEKRRQELGLQRPTPAKRHWPPSE